MSASDQLRLMQAILKRLMDAIGDTLQMYDDFSKIHGRQASEVEKKVLTQVSHKQLEQPVKGTSHYRQRLYEERMRKERLNQQLDARGIGPPRELLTYGQRVAALRNIKQREEKEQKERQKKQPLPKASTKQSKKSSAFIVYLQEKKDGMLQEYPELKPSQVMKLLSQNWKNMTEEEKKPFYRQNLNNRKQFDKKFQEYYSSILYEEKRNTKHGKITQESNQQEDIYYEEDPEDQE